MTMRSFLRAQPDGVFLSVKLQPRASADEICQPVGDELRIRVTAPPVDASANRALVRLVAEHLDCPPNRVALVKGQTSRHKVIKINGMAPEEVLGKLLKAAKD